MNYHMEEFDLHGIGPRKYRTWRLPVHLEGYWNAVTNIICPACNDGVVVRKKELDDNTMQYVQGARQCKCCKRNFVAVGNSANPKLVLVRTK